MKKKAILALVLSALMALQLPMTAMAQDITSPDPYTTPITNNVVEGVADVYKVDIVVDAKAAISDENVSSNAVLDITAEKNVTNQNAIGNVIQFGNGDVGGNVTINGNATSESFAIYVNEGQTEDISVTVKGDVESKNRDGINVESGSGANIQITVDGIIKGKETGASFATIDPTYSFNLKAKSIEGGSSGLYFDGAGSTAVIEGTVKTTGHGYGIKNQGGATVFSGNVESALIGIDNERATVNTGDVTVNVGTYQFLDTQAGGVFAKGNNVNSGTTVGNVTVNSDKDRYSVGIETQSYHLQADTQVKSGNVTVTGTENGAGINLNNLITKWSSCTEAKHTVLVDGNVKSSGVGLEYGMEVGEKGTLVVTGILEGDRGAVAIDDKCTDENMELIVYGLKSENGALINTVTSGSLNNHNAVLAENEATYSKVNYIIRNQSENAGKINLLNTTKKSVTVNNQTYSFDTATEGTRVNVKVDNGYELTAGQIEVIFESDGSYSVIVPRGGCVSLDVILKAVAAAADTTPANTGSIGSAVTGTWSQNFKGEWFFTTNRQVRNSWAYIADPTGAKEGNWYRFGVNGAMLTGWQEIDGKQYYFIETPGADQGKLLMNAVTPDGQKVGADGARI